MCNSIYFVISLHLPFEFLFNSYLLRLLLRNLKLLTPDFSYQKSQ